MCIVKLIFKLNLVCSFLYSLRRRYWVECGFIRNPSSLGSMIRRDIEWQQVWLSSFNLMSIGSKLFFKYDQIGLFFYLFSEKKKVESTVWVDCSERGLQPSLILIVLLGCSFLSGMKLVSFIIAAKWFNLMLSSLLFNSETIFHSLPEVTFCFGLLLMLQSQLVDCVMAIWISNCFGMLGLNACS